MEEMWFFAGNGRYRKIEELFTSYFTGIGGALLLKRNNAVHFWSNSLTHSKGSFEERIEGTFQGKAGQACLYGILNEVLTVCGKDVESILSFTFIFQ